WTRRVRHPNEVAGIDDIVDVMVLHVDPDAEKIALGLKQTRPNPWRELESKYPVGSVVKGTVRNLTDYGAFVEIEEGIDALLHVSDMSWTKKVAHPSEMLERNQELDVKVLSIDADNEKISVGLKQLDRDPWQEVVEAHPIGSTVEAEIAKLVSFGAFARLENGVEGLIHVSEISEDRIQKPEEALSVGDKVTCKVISIDAEDRKIGLSMRENPEMTTGTTSFYGDGGEASVSLGEVVGEAVSRSLAAQDQQALTNKAALAAQEVDSAAVPEPAAIVETGPEVVPEVVEQPVEQSEPEVAAESQDETPEEGAEASETNPA
ncbi:MAG: S1 RNA-binding domain-containing protein, partial [Candidatus Hydrogenedentes bacterium]|nr:S1 RNA-binding domain-containing protein [Candidatus Hydrogenedentota bacterium]